jgi:DNA (cytosine-5)-methyltransferase 1
MITVCDLFCGAGGSALGATAVPGVELVMAANHWDLAIETHAANFPSTDHDCADISQVDPRRYRRTNILWASPECTWQSGARGRRSDDGEPDLFGEVLPSEAGVRSRSTMFDVHRFAEYHHYDAIIVENVVEAFTKWSLRRSWFMGLEDLGYDWRVVSLNSMHAPAIAAPRAPQSRDRAYCVAWKRRNRAPDLEVRPAGWCVPCGKRVAAVQWWKRPGPRRVGKYRTQYLYHCPGCKADVEPYASPAASIIDWSLRGQRIGDRDKPLRPATLARIQAGLDKYAVPTLVPAGGTWNEAARPVTEPMRARSTRETEGLLVPVEGRDGKQPQPAEAPLRTQTARHETALVVPYYGATKTAQPVERPLPAQPTRDHFGVAFIAELRGGGSSARHVDDPLATVTASGNHHMLVRNNGTSPEAGQMCTPLDEPTRTITTAGHQSLVGWHRAKPAVEDCTFRMLAVPEISAAMAFTDGYVVRGNKREQVRQLGNGVTPPAAEWLVRAVVESLEPS